MQRFLTFLPYTLISLGVFFLGVFSGIFYQSNAQNSSFTPITTLEKEKISVLKLTQISPLGIEGSVKGNTLRLSDGQQIITATPGDSFKMNTTSIFRDIYAVIPKDTQFFASAKGKKFYPVSNTKQLETVRPENLVFFTSADEAMKAGKSAGK